MNLRVPRVSRRFALLVGGFFLASSTLLWAFQASGHRVGLDWQVLVGAPSCLPYAAYLMTLHVDRRPAKGDFVVTRMPNSGMPIGAKPGSQIIKQVVGVAGDRVRIEGTELFVNGLHRDRLWLAKSIPGKQPGDFDVNLTLQDGQYFVMGSTQESFDSRYWGPINEAAIDGFARPLF